MSDTKRRNLLVGALAVDMQMTEPEQIVRLVWESAMIETSMLETLLYDQGIIDQDAGEAVDRIGFPTFSFAIGFRRRKFQHVDPIIGCRCW
ncbi:MAG: hypothetical protein R3C05_26605 [Pirellulaceae bacterium]